MSDAVDAELRYTYVSPLLDDAARWADLGDAIASERAPDLRAPADADLSTPDGVAAVAAALADATVITCFDVLDALDDITPLVGWLVSLADRATVVLSTAGSPNQVEELRRLVPSGTVVARQVPVRASAILPGDADVAPPLGAFAVLGDAPAAHHVLAFGPAASRLAPVSAARVADLGAEQAEARRRDADLAYLEARVAQLEA